MIKPYRPHTVPKEELTKYIAYQHGSLIHSADEIFLDDIDFVIHLLKTTPQLYFKLPQIIKNHPEVIKLIAKSQLCYCLNITHDAILQDKNFIL